MTTSLLVIDRIEPSRRMLVNVLTLAGYRVRTADTELHAIDAAAAAADIVVVSTATPDLWLDVLQQLNADPAPPRLPLVLICEPSDRTTALRPSLDAHHAPYLVKPFTSQQLLTTIALAMTPPPPDTTPPDTTRACYDTG